MAELFTSVDGIRDARKKAAASGCSPQRRHVSVLFATGSNRVIPQPKGVVGIVVAVELSALPHRQPAHQRPRRRQPRDGEDGDATRSTSAASSPRSARAVFPEDTRRDPARRPRAGLLHPALRPHHLHRLGRRRPHRDALRRREPDAGDARARRQVADHRLRRLRRRRGRVAHPLRQVPERRADLPRARLPLRPRRRSATSSSPPRKRIVPQRYPDTNQPSYTSVIDEKSYRRLRATLEDARQKGAEVVPLVPGATFNDELRKIPPHLVLDVTDDMTIMQEEIFGPLLPGEDLPHPRRGDRLRERPRPAARLLRLHQRHGDRGEARLLDHLGRRHDQQLHAPRRAARHAVRRHRRERHGALPRLRGLPRVQQAAPGVQEPAPVAAAPLLSAVHEDAPAGDGVSHPLQALSRGSVVLQLVLDRRHSQDTRLTLPRGETAERRPGGVPHAPGQLSLWRGAIRGRRAGPRRASLSLLDVPARARRGILDLRPAHGRRVPRRRRGGPDPPLPLVGADRADVLRHVRHAPDGPLRRHARHRVGEPHHLRRRSRRPSRGAHVRRLEGGLGRDRRRAAAVSRVRAYGRLTGRSTSVSSASGGTSAGSLR